MPNRMCRHHARVFDQNKHSRSVINRSRRILFQSRGPAATTSGLHPDNDSSILSGTIDLNILSSLVQERLRREYG